MHLRSAEPRDAALVIQMIRELASYERLLDRVEATEDDISATLFAPDPRVFCDIGEIDGEPAGFALWFYSYSTFKGRHGIYLEDLFVRPEYRQRGLGKALLARLAQRCVAGGLGRLEWAVLEWNAPSIAFYRALGAEPVDEWSIFRLDGDALRKLGSAPGRSGT